MSKTAQKASKPTKYESLNGTPFGHPVDQSAPAQSVPANTVNLRQSAKKNSLDDHERLVESFRR